MSSKCFERFISFSFFPFLREGPAIVQIIMNLSCICMFNSVWIGRWLVLISFPTKDRKSTLWCLFTPNYAHCSHFKEVQYAPKVTSQLLVHIPLVRLFDWLFTFQFWARPDERLLSLNHIKESTCPQCTNETCTQLPPDGSSPKLCSRLNLSFNVQ